MCISSTLRSWLHYISTRIKFCPLDWRTTIRWNVILAIFQHNYICQDSWKNTKSTFECMVILQSRGQCLDSCWKYGTDLSRSFSSFRTLSPGFENNHIFKCWSGIFPNILTYMSMLENCLNNISVYGCSPIQGTQFFFLLKFNEARISEWNIRITVIYSEFGFRHPHFKCTCGPESWLQELNIPNEG